VCPNLCLIKCVIFVLTIAKLGATIFQSVLQLGGLGIGGIWVSSPVEALIFLFVSVCLVVGFTYIRIHWAVELFPWGWCG